MDASHERATAPASLVPDERLAEHTPRRVLSMLGAGTIGVLAIALVVLDAPRVAAQSVIAGAIFAGALAHIALIRSGSQRDLAISAGRAAGAGLALLGAISITGEAQAMIAQIVLAIVLFQLLDALKPWPAAHLQDRDRGVAIAGDLLVGAYTLAAFLLAVRFFEATSPG